MNLTPAAPRPQPQAPAPVQPPVKPANYAQAAGARLQPTYARGPGGPPQGGRGGPPQGGRGGGPYGPGRGSGAPQPHPGPHVNAMQGPPGQPRPAGPPGAPPAAGTMPVPKEDFDFEQALKKFNKQEIVKVGACAALLTLTGGVWAKEVGACGLCCVVCQCVL